MNVIVLVSRGVTKLTSNLAMSATRAEVTDAQLRCERMRSEVIWYNHYKGTWGVSGKTEAVGSHHSCFGQVHQTCTGKDISCALAPTAISGDAVEGVQGYPY